MTIKMLNHVASIIYDIADNVEYALIDFLMFWKNSVAPGKYIPSNALLKFSLLKFC